MQLISAEVKKTFLKSFTIYHIKMDNCFGIVFNCYCMRECLVGLVRKEVMLVCSSKFGNERCVSVVKNLLLMLTPVPT